MVYTKGRMMENSEARRQRMAAVDGLPGTSNTAQNVSRTDRTAIRVLQMVGEILKQARKPALSAALAIIMVWLFGRVLEALHGNVVFDATLAYWLGMAVFILIVLWLIGSGTAALENLGKANNKKLAAVSWVFFAAMVLTALFNFEGYRISAEGLFASVAGSHELTRQADFLLFKFHSLNPMLAANLVASKLVGAGWDADSLAPYVWSWNLLFIFFLWSLAYGIVVLLQRHKWGAKSLHLCLAVAGLLALIILKSFSKPTIEQMAVFQAAAAILLVFQVLLAYACLNALAAGNEAEEPATKEKRPLGLPPSALKLALCLFIILPILADLGYQFGLSSSSSRIVYEISRERPGSAPQFVAVTGITIRTGPALGEEVIGVLPKGMRVPVLGKKNDWVNIGKNEWIPEKFLTPIK